MSRNTASAPFWPSRRAPRGVRTVECSLRCGLPSHGRNARSRCWERGAGRTRLVQRFPSAVPQVSVTIHGPFGPRPRCSSLCGTCHRASSRLAGSQNGLATETHLLAGQHTGYRRISGNLPKDSHKPPILGFAEGWWTTLEWPCRSTHPSWTLGWGICILAQQLAVHQEKPYGRQHSVSPRPGFHLRGSG